MPSLVSSVAKSAAALPVAGALLLVGAPADAASLQPVPAGMWGTGAPSYVSMYIYVPDKPAAKPPIVVASHYCGGTASGMFSLASGVVSAANTNGFIMIFPQTSNNCWDVGSAAGLSRNVGGDAQAITQMVKYAITTYGADADRVYALGTSSGAMMTQALVGLFPDIFKAGAEFSGVPDGCWSVGFTTCTPSSCWSNSCAAGQVSKTAQQWGDLVRAQSPGYTGFRPRLQLWHGDMDGTINYNNQGEAIKEWTNVLGLSTTPTSMDSSLSGFTGQIWKNSCGFTVLEAYDDVGYGATSNHAVPVQTNAVISFFALDKTGPDPQVAACADAGAGSTGTTGGATTGSTGQASNATGSDGGAGTTGSVTSTTGGTTGVANTTGTIDGGTTGTVGGATGGTIGTTGATTGSDTGPTTGGVADSSSSNDTTGDSGTSGTGTEPDASTFPSGAGSSSSSGCSCHVGGTPSRGRAAETLSILALGLLLRRRRRTRQV
jgi:poly(hydroxyalkanoate) depolymerase family esterase